MKKISIFAVLAVAVMLFGAAVSAKATPAFNFTSTLSPTTANPITFSGPVEVTYIPSLTPVAATLTTTYSAINGYTVILDGSDVIKNGVLVANIPDFFVIVGANEGTFTADSAIPGQLTGSFAPAPEASSVLGLGAMLAAGGLMFFVAKRKSASTIA